MSNNVRPLEEIVRAHDALVGLICHKEQDPNFRLLMTEEQRANIICSADVLCWVLMHEHNSTFAKNLAQIAQTTARGGLPAPQPRKLMNVYCYYSDIPQLPAYDELKLIMIWRERWKSMGFEPVVLSEYQARQHPDFGAIARDLDKLPSVNPAGYDKACYYRWIAMAVAAPYNGIMSDYDVLPRAPDHDGQVRGGMMRLTDITGAQAGGMQFHQGPVPSLVRGSTSAFQQIVDYFRRCAQVGEYKQEKINGQPHVSDMYLIEQFLAGKPDGFQVFNSVKLWGEQGWQDAAFTHFSNSVMLPAGKAPRWKHVL